MRTYLTWFIFCKLTSYLLNIGDILMYFHFTGCFQSQYGAADGDASPWHAPSVASTPKHAPTLAVDGRRPVWPARHALWSEPASAPPTPAASTTSTTSAPTTTTTPSSAATAAAVLRPQWPRPGRLRHDCASPAAATAADGLSRCDAQLRSAGRNLVFYNIVLRDTCGYSRMSRFIGNCIDCNWRHNAKWFVVQFCS